jgi:hypothetical protein
MDVAVTVRADAFLERFIERVGALAAARSRGANIPPSPR